MAMRGWYPNVLDSDTTLCGRILFGCGLLLIFGLFILFGLYITTPNSSGKAGNHTMSIDEFASEDGLSSVKFLYSEKATKFCEISTLLLTGNTCIGLTGRR